MDDDAPVREAPVPPAEDAPPGEKAGEFERYALLAALTLVVLGLLIWDNWHGSEDPLPPPPDRALRVEIGAEPRARETRPVERHADPAPPRPPEPPPVAAAAREYVVRSGDTLGEIASRELGSASRAREIADLNGLADAARIRAGQVLKLPAR